MSERDSPNEPFAYNTDSTYDAVAEYTLGRSEFFTDLYELQNTLSTRIFDSATDILINTQDVTKAINENAAEAGILTESVTVIGKSEAIHRPYVLYSPDDNTTHITHKPDDDEETDIVHGVLSHIEIIPEHHPELTVITHEGTSEKLEDVYTPRIAYMVYARGIATPNGQIKLYHHCQVGEVSLDFDRDTEFQLNERFEDDMSKINQAETPVKHNFEELESALWFSDDADANGKSVRAARRAIHKLLNKLDSKEQPWIEDAVVDLVNSRISREFTYDIETPYTLTSKLTENGNVTFEPVTPLGTPFKTHHVAVQPLTISCLPRSYIASDDTKQCTVRNDQKALYVTFSEGDELFHIPLEHMYSIKQSE